MDIVEMLSSLEDLENRLFALRHALGVLNLDGVTAAPKGSSRPREKTVGILAGEEYRLLSGESTRRLLVDMEEAAPRLPARARRQAQELSRDFKRISCVPMAEYTEYARVVSVATDVWHESKEKSDFASFLPWLEKIVDFSRRFALYRNGAADPYDTVLDGYEKGLTRAALDPFFALLKERLIPLIRAIGEKSAPPSVRGFYPVEDQKRLTEYLMDFLGLDRERCAAAETEHPFTDAFSRWDVRITTHDHTEDLLLSLYSVMHEGGHALYESGVGEDLQFTCLGRGSSMSIHESQSRFYENIIGRSETFIRRVFPVISELFPGEMRSRFPEDGYRASNLLTHSQNRTQADEVTYPLHVIIRYELEKALFDGDLKCADLPGAWAEMYRKYLGVAPSCDREGVLQDSHWSGGMLGYFPSYALGSAYAAQMLDTMKKTVDVEGAISAGDLSPVTSWLRERIHRHGRMLDPKELLLNAFDGAPFDPECYVRYLTDKYTALYGL